MKYRKHIYCEIEFIKLCIEKLDAPNASCSPEVLLLLNTIKNIVSGTCTKLYMNISREEVDKFSKDIYKRKLNAAKKGKQAELSSFEQFMYNLLWKQQNGETQIRYFDKIDFDCPDEIDLNAYYFTCKGSEQCRKAMSCYGVLVLNTENINDFGFVLKDNGGAVSKSPGNTWKTLLEPIKKTPYNSLVIIDNYILNNTEEMVENLEGIFDALLPSNISVPFQITIFSKLGTEQNNNSCLPSEPRMKKIKEMLSKYDSYEIELCIIKCQGFHDRVLLTNSMLIGCPGGFNLFKDGVSQKTTYFNATNPFLADVNIKWTTEAYSNYIADAAPVFQDVQENGSNGITDSFPKFYLGEKKNRIIEGYIG